MLRAMIAAAVLLSASTAAANDVLDALATMDDGRLRFEYATREDVRGDGRSLTFSADYGDWDCDCEEGPARVQIRVRDGEVFDVDVHVGGRWRTNSNVTVRDLGTVDALDARDALMSIATTAEGGDVDDAIVGVIVADAPRPFDRLIEIARDRDRPRPLRESSIFWLGQAAGERATTTLSAIVDDDDEELNVREHAIFSLSQRDVDECFEPLRRVALESRHPQLREKAFFWLAQHDDPRVVDLLEEVLLGE